MVQTVCSSAFEADAGERVCVFTLYFVQYHTLNVMEKNDFLSMFWAAKQNSLLEKVKLLICGFL